MVDCELRPNKVTDERVLTAFETLPREEFVPRNQRAIAYVDEDLPLPGGRSMMEPMVLSRIVQALDVQQHHVRAPLLQQRNGLWQQVVHRNYLAPISAGWAFCARS